MKSYFSFQRLIGARSFINCALVFYVLFFSAFVSAEASDLEKTAGEYFATNDYEGFYQYLKNTQKPGPELYYYLALTRQKNIDYWQETKNWEGVYDKAGDYKKEIVENLKLAEASLVQDAALSFNIKYLKWLRSTEDDPDSSQGLFNDLLESAKSAVGSEAGLEAVKNAADSLSLLEDKFLSRRLYEIYVGALIESESSGKDLRKRAVEFLAADNIYLAKRLFETYLSKISDFQELRARESITIADLFSHQDRAVGPDPVYAEDMYKQAADSAGISAFSADSQYRRAFNLERMKEYLKASQEYSDLLKNFTEYPGRPAVYFRLGVINAYALNDVDTAIEYFSKAEAESEGVLRLESIYQIGLLNHYRQDTPKASEFYRRCLSLAKESGINEEDNQVCSQAKDRLSEIDDQREIRYGLKLFLDGIFNRHADGSIIEATGLDVDLVGNPAKQDKEGPVRFLVTTSNPQTGCMTPVYAYEWSGETGKVENIPNSPEFNTDYASNGIKVVHVAVVGPDGLEGASFDMVEVE